MILFLTAYLCVGLLLAIWMTTLRESEELGTGGWTYVILAWPIYMASAAPAVLRLWEVRFLKRAVRCSVRRLERLGYSVSMEKTDGKV
jgi:hypothetical protein